MKYFVKVIQPNEGFENEICFQFDNYDDAMSHIRYTYRFALAFDKDSRIELCPFDDVKARQEELLDGITEDVEKAFKEAMLNAEEEEDLESLADSEHSMESESGEVW